MARHVFDDDDGVVHQNANRKDQRKERDAIERVAVEVEDRQRQRQRHRNRNRHDAGFAQSQRQPDQQLTPTGWRSSCATAVHSIFRAAVSP